MNISKIQIHSISAANWLSFIPDSDPTGDFLRSTFYCASHHTAPRQPQVACRARLKSSP
jgi:hypothetical protein